jgi:hypothetical protein
MELLVSLLVGKPLNILTVAAVFLVICVARRRTTGVRQRDSRWPIAAAIAWAAYAAWEWLVLVRTPEANIRVDLLLIWPILAALSAWAIFRVFR